MNEQQIFNIIRPIILDVTGVPEVILADPNASAPAGSYAAVQPQQSIEQHGQAVIHRSNVPGEPNINIDPRAQVIANCSVNFYRADAMTYAQRLFQANKRPDVSAALFLAGLGWSHAGPINNLTALQASRYEPRAQLSIFLMYETTDEVTINSIERATVIVENEKAEELTRVDIETPDAP